MEAGRELPEDNGRNGNDRLPVDASSEDSRNRPSAHPFHHRRDAWNPHVPSLRRDGNEPPVAASSGDSRKTYAPSVDPRDRRKGGEDHSARPRLWTPLVSAGDPSTIKKTYMIVADRNGVHINRNFFSAAFADLPHRRSDKHATVTAATAVAAER